MNRTQKNKLIKIWIIITGVLMGITVAFCWFPLVSVPTLILVVISCIIGITYLLVDLLKMW